MKNCPVSHEDVELAMGMFGKDVAVIKGKDMRPKSASVNKEDAIDLPPELLIKETELAIGVLYVADQALLHSVDRKVKGKTLVPLGTIKKADAKDLMGALEKIIRHYNKADIECTMVHADNEFRPLEDMMAEDSGVLSNFAAPDEHVPDIERANRVLEERFRVEYHHLPFRVMPHQIIRALMSRCTFNGDLFIQEGGAAATTPCI